MSFRLLGREAYADVQVARHLHHYKNHQWRADSSVGFKPSARWLIVAQAFAGQTDQSCWEQARWLNGQVSAVGYFDGTDKLGIQLGLRRTLSGQKVPNTGTWVVALWRKF